MENLRCSLGKAGRVGRVESPHPAHRRAEHRRRIRGRARDHSGGAGRLGLVLPCRVHARPRRFRRRARRRSKDHHCIETQMPTRQRPMLMYAGQGDAPQGESLGEGEGPARESRLGPCRMEFAKRWLETAGTARSSGVTPLRRPLRLGPVTAMAVWRVRGLHTRLGVGGG